MRNSVPSRKRSACVCFCLLLLVGSMWIHSQTGGWPDGPCQYMSVCPDKATDMSQTERCFPSLDSRFIYLSVKLILSYGITVFKTIKLQISL